MSLIQCGDCAATVPSLLMLAEKIVFLVAALTEAAPIIKKITDNKEINVFIHYLSRPCSAPRWRRVSGPEPRCSAALLMEG